MSRINKDMREPTARQLEEWSEKNKGKVGETTDHSGIDVVTSSVSLTAGPRGPIVLRDTNLIQTLQSFARERIPERVVHAKGAGAFGYFEVTNDITKYTVSKVFDSIGKKTPIAIRFSQVIGHLGSADTVRDVRGFAVKFYTEEGIWDITGNNTPIFFVRDPILFMHFIHSLKPNPVTNLRDWDMHWDFITLRPETLHQTLILYSDRGIPDGHRHQHGFGSHTFSMIGKNRELTWVKFHFKTDQGIRNLEPSKADEIAGKDPDYALRDLYNAIEKGKCTGKYPSWTFYIQTMTVEEANKSNFDPFDLTKVWPHDQFPLQKVGKLVLNKNPTNYFAEIEQLAFSPNNLTPGFGPSPDRMLQARLFSYDDTHYYRLGVNFPQLPVNRPINKVRNYERDGSHVIMNQNGAPNYYPNMFGGPYPNPEAEKWTYPPEKVEGTVDYYDTSNEDNVSQPRKFYQQVLNDAERGRLMDNIVSTLKLANGTIQDRAVEVFGKIDQDLGNGLRQRLGRDKVVHL